MERYLIETRHTAENCLALVEEINAQGYLSNFDWGCKNGVHTGWAVIEADNESEARLVVPPLVRGQAQVVKVTKFDGTMLAEMHKDESDRKSPGMLPNDLTYTGRACS